MGWFGPGGDCGCCDGVDPPIVCDILNDDFDRSDSGSLGGDWDEVAGTWSIDTNLAETSSNDAIAVSVAEADVSDENYVVSVDLIGDKTKLIFDYVDEDNYHDIIFNSGSSLQIRKTTAGTTVVDHTNSFSTTGSVFVKVCVFNVSDSLSDVLVNYGSTPNAFLTKQLLHEGLMAGIGTDTVGGDVQFDDFNFGLYSDQTNPDCQECITPCSVDCCDSTSAAYVIDFTGVSLSDTTNCTGCDALTGKFTLVSAGDCFWSYTELMPGCCVDDPGVVSQRFAIGLNVVKSGGDCTWKSRIYIGYNVNPDEPGPTDCEEDFIDYESAVFTDTGECDSFGTKTLTLVVDNGGDQCSADWPTTVTLETL